MSDDETTRAAGAHAAYLAQTRQLVDTQTEALFGMVTTVLARAGSRNPAARHAGVSRQDHTLTVSNGPCAEAFTVDAISDLPDGADRAHLFPMGQARCRVHIPDGHTVEWWLKRDTAGDSASSYGWMVAGADTPVGAPEITGVLRPLLECAPGGRGDNHILAASVAC